MSEQSTTQDPFEMFRRLWGPLGLPVPGMAMPTLDPQEIERRIAELRSVEAWLTVNLNMLRMAIQGLEMQKTALQAMRAAADAGKAAGTAAAPQAEALAELAANTAANTMLWPWAMIQQAMKGDANAGKQGAGEAPPPPEKGKRK
jgi:hypothetical protein